jgi:methylated-DNA-[protein]-cysteine S-methyltransferase
MAAMAFLRCKFTMEKFKHMKSSEHTSLHFQYLDSPLGRLRLVAEGMSLQRIEFEDQHGADGEESTSPVLEKCKRQLTEYFRGERHDFALNLDAAGTAFQQRVWQALQTIPYGELRSYRDIAEQTGNGRAVRAVGSANGKNPLPIVVPCHRVIGSNGSLTGFAGGLTAKKILLELEGSSWTG